MNYPYDGECQASCARAALFFSSRRDASRPCATECEPLARAPPNCHASVNRRRALTRRSDAHTVATVLGTCFGAQKFEIPLTESGQPTPQWQLHLPRCCNSRAGAGICGILKPSRKQVIPNLERTTIALSFYSAFTTDNALAGRHAAMLLIHTSAPQDLTCYCHTE